MINIITGITGQLGIYLSEIITNENKVIYGLTRNRNSINKRLVKENIRLIQFDYKNMEPLENLLRNNDDINIFNLAAQSSVRLSWEKSHETFEINFDFVRQIISLIENFPTKKIKLIQIGSSEQFDKNENLPWTELTKFSYNSPYSESKIRAYNLCKSKRVEKNLWISNLITFNNESIYRSKNMLTKQIISKLNYFKVNQKQIIAFDDLYISRDWMHTRDVANALYLVSQLAFPSDYVVCSGVETTLIELINKFYYNMFGVYLPEKSKLISLTDKDEIKFYAKRVLGDSSKLKKDTGWFPQISVDEMVYKLVNELH